MNNTQTKRMFKIRHAAFDIVYLTERLECLANGSTTYLATEKQIVSRLNEIIRNLSPFATEDEAIETHGTYWTPGEENK